jgi:DNA-binding Xre family transcriptional regulator
MALSYIKLWKLLLDKKMKKTDLIKTASISSNTLARLSKDQQVSMEAMMRICKALSCDIGDIMEVLPDDEDKTEDV